jgi:hypothetical protein
MASYTLSKVFRTKTHRSFVHSRHSASYPSADPTYAEGELLQLLASDKVFPFIILPFTLVQPSSC